jgi:hypothetical protein
MTEAVIYQEDPDATAPGTHAIIIGIGNYPYLVGGTAPQAERFTHHEGMGQLSSPQLSARSLATWLLTEYNNPERPLASLALLVSEREMPSLAVPPLVPEPVVPPPATMVNIDSAVRAWKRRGDAHADNLMLFFFSGHGVSQGTDQLLLAEDFGQNHENPFAMAVHFPGLFAGMKSCVSLNQYYILDTCRSSSSLLIESYRRGGNLPVGQPIIFNYGPAHTGNWQTACLFSTLMGQNAYSREGRETVFVDALLQSLRSYGSYRITEDDSWRVSTDSLKKGIDHLLGRNPEQSQWTILYGDSNFDLYYLKEPPRVSVTIRCQPQENNRVATLSYMFNEVVIDSRPPRKKDWETVIPYDNYTFMARFPDQRCIKKGDSVIPPHHFINLREG